MLNDRYDNIFVVYLFLFRTSYNMYAKIPFNLSTQTWDKNGGNLVTE
jgi:hypothetical protein